MPLDAHNSAEGYVRVQAVQGTGTTSKLNESMATNWRREYLSLNSKPSGVASVYCDNYSGKGYVQGEAGKDPNKKYPFHTFHNMGVSPWAVDKVNGLPLLRKYSLMDIGWTYQTAALPPPEDDVRGSPTAVDSSEILGGGRIINKLLRRTADPVYNEEPDETVELYDKLMNRIHRDMTMTDKELLADIRTQAPDIVLTLPAPPSLTTKIFRRSRGARLRGGGGDAEGTEGAVGTAGAAGAEVAEGAVGTAGAAEDAVGTEGAAATAFALARGTADIVQGTFKKNWEHSDTTGVGGILDGGISKLAVQLDELNQPIETTGGGIYTAMTKQLLSEHGCKCTICHCYKCYF